MNNLVEVRRLAGFCVILVAIVVSVCCGKSEKSAVAPARTNAPLLTKLAPEDEVVSKTIPPPLGRIYPFKEPVTFNGFVSGTLETNVMTVPVNDEIFRVVTVTAKMVIQAPWENMMLQWNYDRPVDAQTNRYKLVR